MARSTIVVVLIALLVVTPARAQFAVIDPANLAQAILIVQRLLTEHPAATAAGALAVAASTGALALATARLRDRHARASHPQGPGVVIGSVRRQSRLARRACRVTCTAPHTSARRTRRSR